MSEQLPLVARAPARAGIWEKLAGKRIRELARAGYLTPDHAGYADALRMAGRNLDAAESVGNTRDRLAAADAWQAALARIIPAPADSAASAAEADPWAELARVITANDSA